MKQLSLLAALVAFTLLSVLTENAAAQENATAEPLVVHVSPAGDDSNSGETVASSVKSVAKAVEIVRELRNKENASATIQLAPGTYRLERELKLGSQDSDLRFVCQGKEKAILSGGRPITRWTKTKTFSHPFPTDAQPHIWQAKLETSHDVLTVYQADLPLSTFSELMPIKMAIPASKLTSDCAFEGKFVTPLSDSLADYLTGATLHTNEATWATNFLKFKSYDKQSETFTLTDSMNYSGYHTRSQVVRETRGYLMNMPHFVNQEGHWYFNKQEQTIYLYSKSDPNESTYEVPIGNQLVVVDGADRVSFEGLVFEINDIPYNKNGDKSLQHEWASLDKGNALLRLRNARHCEVKNCEFRKCFVGVRFDLASQHNKVTQCTFQNYRWNACSITGYGIGTTNDSGYNEISQNLFKDRFIITTRSSAIVIGGSSHNRVLNNRVVGESKGKYGPARNVSNYYAVQVLGLRPEWLGKNGIRKEHREAASIRWHELPAGLREKPSDFQWQNYCASVYNDVSHNDFEGGEIYVSASGRNLFKNNFLRNIRYDDLCFDSVSSFNILHSGMEVERTTSAVNNLFIGKPFKDAGVSDTSPQYHNVVVFSGSKFDKQRFFGEPSRKYPDGFPLWRDNLYIWDEKQYTGETNYIENHVQPELKREQGSVSILPVALPVKNGKIRFETLSPLPIQPIPIRTIGIKTDPAATRIMKLLDAEFRK